MTMHRAQLMALRTSAKEFAAATEILILAQNNRDMIANRIADDALPPSSIEPADKRVADAQWQFDYLMGGLRRLMEPLP